MAKNQKSKNQKLNKTKNKINLRVAGEKVSGGSERPSQRLFAEVKRQIDQEKSKIEETPITPPTTPYHPLPPPTTKNFDTSPKRDFTKVANSINRDVLSKGLFKGTSKGTYDALYQKTRGAISPTRKIKVVQSDLLLWSGVSHNTLRNHLKYLESIRLIKIDYKLGDNEGAIYEIFLPEEVGLTLIPYHPLPPPTTSDPNLGSPSTHFQVGGGGGLSPINTEGNELSKTSLKTKNKNDDDSENAFSDFFEKLEKANIKITGKKPSLTEREKWSEVAELLVIELELAAARTDSVSSVPAFLKEVLRRKLEKKSISPKGKSSAKASPKGVSRSLQVGKPGSIRADEEADWEKENMSAEEKQKTLLIMRDRIKEGHKDLMMSMEQAYSKSDWQWLTDKLEERSKSGS